MRTKRKKKRGFRALSRVSQTASRKFLFIPFGKNVSPIVFTLCPSLHVATLQRSFRENLPRR